jgi:phage recombination protein Bet
MSNGTVATAAPRETITVPKTMEVEFQPFQSEDKIKLTVQIIQDYIAVPTKNGHKPTKEDAVKFMMLCRSRKLNPFEGDCFMLGYENSDGTIQFSLITAHQAFLKRAEVHPEFDGFESGVIVKVADKAEPLEREGDFLWPGDVLLGGWCVVRFKSRKFPMRKRVALGTFVKTYGQWKTNAAGMIVKCAEADALRSSFPTLLGGLYLDDERPPIDVTATVTSGKAPDFGSERPQVTTAAPAKIADRAPAKPVEPQKGVSTPAAPETTQGGAPAAAAPAATESPEPAQPATTAPEPPPKPAGDPPPTESTPSEALKSIRLLMEKSGVTESQVMAYCREKSMARNDQTKLAELSEAKLITLGKTWYNALPQIRGA